MKADNDKNDKVSFELPIDVSKKLRDVAKREGLSLSDIIRMAIRKFLKN